MAIIWFRKNWLDRIITGPPGDCAACALRILNQPGRVR